MGLNGARIPLRSLSTDWKYCGLVDGRWACGSRVCQKYVVACALIYAGDVELSNIYTSVNTSPIEGTIASTSAGYRNSRNSIGRGREEEGRPQTRPAVDSDALQPEVRNQEALAEVKVTVVASSKWQPWGTVSATQERNRKPGVVVFGMAHQLNAELVFTKAGRSVIVGIARRYEVIKLVGATYVSKRHHALFGKGQILLELAEPEVQPRRSPEIVQPHVSRFKSNSAGTHIN